MAEVDVINLEGEKVGKLEIPERFVNIVKLEDTHGTANLLSKYLPNVDMMVVMAMYRNATMR